MKGFMRGPFKLHCAEEHLLADGNPYQEEMESFKEGEVNLNFLGLMLGYPSTLKVTGRGDNKP